MPGKIVILEDDATLAKNIATVLSLNKYEVKITSNSDMFFTEFRSFYPDVVLLDVILKGSPLNGIEVLKIIRKESVTNAKVIVLSGEANAAQIDDIRHLGAYHFIEKGSGFNLKHRNKIGFFERCDDGILFLDEITNLSIAAQSKILRAIENKEIQVVGGESKKVDARLLFASNATLEKLSQPEVFRKDLFYRIEGNIVELLPLRQRGDDIILLMSYFFSSYAQQFQNADYCDLSEIKDDMLSYSWPGNIRELKNFCKFILINEREINNEVILKHLEVKILKNNGIAESSLHKYLRMDKLKDGIASFEKDFLHFHLNRHNWRISHTARQIGIERTTLYKKMKTYNLISDKP
jgi:DNA-binding NtrC family response regulator